MKEKERISLKLHLILEALKEIDRIEAEWDTLEEGAVKTEHKPVNRVNKLLEKYGYDKNKGTIKVDGNEIKVTIDKRRNSQTHSILSSKPDKIGNIVISEKDNAKLKNNKRRDTILNHEIGHIINNKKDKTSADHIKSARANAEERFIKGIKDLDGIPDSELRSLIDGYMDLHGTDNDIRQNNSKDSAREKNKTEFNKMTKHIKNDHTNVSEFEADAYASINSDNVKRALRNDYKIQRNKLKNELRNNKSHMNRNEYHNQNKLNEEDLQKRNKALNSKHIDKSVYKRD